MLKVLWLISREGVDWIPRTAEVVAKLLVSEVGTDLGPNAFGEITGEVVNCALFTLRNAPPSSDHRFTGLRLIGPKIPAAKDALLCEAVASVRRPDPGRLKACPTLEVSS